MIDRDLVSEKAHEIAFSRDDLTETEAMVLHHLLFGDEAFGQLVTAADCVEAVDSENHGIDEATEELVTEAAVSTKIAVENIIDEKRDVAVDIVQFAGRIDEPWPVALNLYTAGYRTCDDLVGASRAELAEHVEAPEAERVATKMEVSA